MLNQLLRLNFGVAKNVCCVLARETEISGFQTEVGLGLGFGPALEFRLWVEVKVGVRIRVRFRVKENYGQFSRYLVECNLK